MSLALCRIHAGLSSIVTNATSPSVAPPTATAPTNNNGAHQTTSTDDEFLRFSSAVAAGGNVIPVCRRIFSDQLTPVVAYRCLIKENDIEAPSFLLESVVNGDQQGR